MFYIILIQPTVWYPSSRVILSLLRVFGAPPSLFPDINKIASYNTDTYSDIDRSSRKKVKVSNNVKVEKGMKTEQSKTPTTTSSNKCCFDRCDQIGNKVHPYVPMNHRGEKLFFCEQHLKNWNKYRNLAKQNKQLFVNDDPNEELCAVCSAVPTKLIMCSTCPRSYCRECLLQISDYKYLKQVRAQDEWSCLVCTNSFESVVAPEMLGNLITKAATNKTKRASKHCTNSTFLLDDDCLGICDLTLRLKPFSPEWDLALYHTEWLDAITVIYSPPYRLTIRDHQK